MVYCEKKPLSALWYSFSFSLDMHFKNMFQIRNFWDLTIRAQRWIRFSKYVTPLGKMREDIILWHVRNTKILHFFKMIFHQFIIVIWKWWLNMPYFCLLQVKTQHHLAGFDLIYPHWSWYLGFQIFGITLRKQTMFHSPHLFLHVASIY